MDIVVNGTPRHAPANASVLQLLESLGLNPSTVVVERNGVVVERSSYTAATLQEADRVEIVRFVGGG